jgi:two-component system, NarL family, response regulator LiaR
MKTQEGVADDPKLAHQPSRPFSVVIVADDDIFRAQVEGWLGQNPRFACVGSYSDGKTALAKICSKKLDLAIVEYRMLGTKDNAVIRHLKARAPSAKIVVITGIPDNEVVFDTLGAGADGFLDKDRLTRRAFLTQLDRLMAGAHPLSERAASLLVAEYVRSLPRPDMIELLTPREREVAERKCRGLSSEAIAREHGISIWTVRTHERNINSKLHSRNRAELHFKLYGIRKPKCL